MKSNSIELTLAKANAAITYIGSLNSMSIFLLSSFIFLLFSTLLLLAAIFEDSENSFTLNRDKKLGRPTKPSCSKETNPELWKAYHRVDSRWQLRRENI